MCWTHFFDWYQLQVRTSAETVLGRVGVFNSWNLAWSYPFPQPRFVSSRSESSVNFFCFVKRELAGKSYKIKIHAIISFYFSFHVKYRLPSRAQYELLNSTVEINCSGEYVCPGNPTQPECASIKLDFCRIGSETGDGAWHKIFSVSQA